MTQTAAPTRPSGALKRLIIRGSAYEIIGYGTAQVIRFASNLVLSRLLFPEAYGLSAMVNIMNQGLIMLSDVGLPAVVVQSPRGDELKFLNTVFTWQAVRAVLLFVAASLLAVPMAIFFEADELKLLIPFGALSVLLMGLRSTSTYTQRRRLELGPILAIELASQVGSVAVMVPWALIKPSVWTLIGGNLTSSVITVIGSHIVKVGYRNKFEWDKDSAKDMFQFGKWIAGSSMLTFAGQQGDRLLLGRYLGTAGLGVYSIAVFLSSALGEAITRITTGVFFPAYSRVFNESRERLREVFYKTRLVVDGLMLPALGALAVLGPTLVHWLYDPRYEQAGWMLRILAIRVALACLASPMQFCLFAVGESRYGFYLNLARVVSLIIGVPIGFHFGGISGLIWAVTLSEFPALVVVYTGLARSKVISWIHELRAPACYAVGAAVGWGVLRLLEHLGWAHTRIHF